MPTIPDFTDSQTARFLYGVSDEFAEKRAVDYDSAYDSLCAMARRIEGRSALSQHEGVRPEHDVRLGTHGQELLGTPVDLSDFFEYDTSTSRITRSAYEAQRLGRLASEHSAQAPDTVKVDQSPHSSAIYAPAESSLDRFNLLVAVAAVSSSSLMS